MPPIAVASNQILHQASIVYTHKIYKLFEKELVESLGTTFQEVIKKGNISYFEVILSKGMPKKWEVQFDSSNRDAIYNSKKFESIGVLCCHAL